MGKLIIRDNKDYYEPDVIYNGINLAELPGVTRITFDILPNREPKLIIEVECVDEIDVKAVFGDSVITEIK